jgi:acyl carrier protein
MENNPVDERVIIFTANYTGYPVDSINDSTVLANIGIVTEADRVQYMMELEESFGLIYQEGDANGIVTVGDATELIEKKLGSAGA